MIELSEYNTCLICLQNIINYEYILTCCNTYYHNKCIKKWISNKNSCPHCRKNIKNNVCNISENLILYPNNENDITEERYNNLIIKCNFCCILTFIFIEVILVFSAIILLILYITKSPLFSYLV